MPHHQEHAQIGQHAAQPGLPIPIHPISVCMLKYYVPQQSIIREDLTNIKRNLTEDYLYFY